MPLNLLTTTLCGRGEVNIIRVGATAAGSFVIDNQSQDVDQVQYWGSLQEEVSEPTIVSPGQWTRFNLQMYKQAHLFSLPGVNPPRTARLIVWIPREYRFLTAIVRLYQVT
jgi:hypothetical protein